MKKVLKVIRIIFGVECVLATLGGVILTVETPSAQNILLTLVCAGLAFLLLRKRKQKDEPQVWKTSETVTPLVSIKTELTQPDVPQDILRDMRKTYTKADAMRDAQIMRESFLLCQQTYDFEVFAMRSSLAQRMAYTLLQAERAGCRGVARLNTRKAAESVLQATAALKMDFLGRAVKKAVDDALALKTPRGQRNRLERLLNVLEAQETTFAEIEDEYNDIMGQVQERLAEIEKAGEA